MVRLVSSVFQLADVQRGFFSSNRVNGGSHTSHHLPMQQKILEFYKGVQAFLKSAIAVGAETTCEKIIIFNLYCGRGTKKQRVITH